MTDKLTISNCMVGSAIKHSNGNYETLTTFGLKNLYNDEDYFSTIYRKAPLTPEVLEKCPLPYPYALDFSWNPYNFIILRWYNDDERWHGKYISDLQLYFRSLELEWDLTKLFE